MSIEIYDKTSLATSKRVALNYSTSFSLGIKMLSPEYRWAIFSVYGFVRVADEIVDTFHDYPKEKMLQDYKRQTYTAIEEGISTNPVLHSFQKACNKFNIGKELIDPFFNSMEADLKKSEYDENGYEEYIYGSAEVVGLMCLKVFCNGNSSFYEELKPFAQSLGSAFQKVNFLRDLGADYEKLGRVYFPNVKFKEFNEPVKRQLVEDIRKDFNKALVGIKKLPIGCRFGVFTAYIYYLKLLEKISRSDVSTVMDSRIRIADGLKLKLFLKSYIKYKIRLI